MDNKTNIFKTKYFKIIFLVLIDIISIVVSGFAALFVRFEFSFSALAASGFWPQFLESTLFVVPVTVIIFVFCRLYNSLWKYAGLIELVYVVLGSSLSTLTNLILIKLLDINLPRSFPLLYLVALVIFVGASRLFYRFIRSVIRKDEKNLKRTMIIGAGSAGAMVLRELRVSPRTENKVVCFIDDDREKWNTRMNGVIVAGGCDKIAECIERYKIDEVLLAIPSISENDKKKIISIVESTEKPLKLLPSISQLANCEVSIASFRNIEIEDLLSREPIKIEIAGLKRIFKDTTVLVTGGGGSIGSELCRQIASLEPKRLIIFDIYENNAYSIQQELVPSYPDEEIITLIGSVRDRARLDGIFDEYRPDYVFHAAAHKHVPLMEDSPLEAVKNNVFGTLNVAEACDRHSVKRMLLVSTDKAVNPTNVMGASKRMCEMIVQMMNNHSATDYVAVRFGNVLGSNGSVVPLFRSQIDKGGPVTVTDPNIIRYFMTIPEAVSLILDACTYAHGGEIFVLDMGKPVKIDDMARKMIRLSGYTPDVDIKIVYTGLRPGEKLYEELLMDEEGMVKTANDLIYIGNPIMFDETFFREKLRQLYKACEDENTDIRTLISEIIPTYRMKHEAYLR